VGHSDNLIYPTIVYNPWLVDADGALAARPIKSLVRREVSAARLRRITHGFIHIDIVSDLRN
jgi:hypothetical protein